MQDAMEDVQEFRKKHYRDLKPCTSVCKADQNMLFAVATSLKNWSERLHDQLIRHPKSIPILRAHLMIEELSELLVGMAHHSKVDMLDGLADLCYVVIGTALDYDLPLAQAWNEVHKANMTKPCGDNLRVSHGDNYTPPDIQGVLDRVHN